MEIYAININDISVSEYDKIRGYVSEEKKCKLDRFVFYEDKIRSALGEVLIKVLVCDKYKIEFEKINIKKSPYGKPYIEKRDAFFNISHSGEWVVVSIDDEEVGIDVEYINRNNEYVGIIDNVLTEEEKQFLGNNSKCDEKEGFYRFWTLKESYIKLIGKGLSIPLKSFFIENQKDEIYWKSKCRYFNKYAKYKSYSNYNDYIVSVCSFKEEFPEKISEVNIDFILDKLNWS